MFNVGIRGADQNWKKSGRSLYVKINTDGGFEAESMSGATDAVIRDENGVFIKAMVRRLPSVASALVVEAEAWRDGLRLLCQSFFLKQDRITVIH
jgi:hypothetical protein